MGSACARSAARRCASASRRRSRWSGSLGTATGGHSSSPAASSTLGASRRSSFVPGDYADGAAVDVMIRPEEITVVFGAEEGTVPAVVKRAGFLGSEAVYQLECEGAELIASAPLERGAPLASDGQRVGVRIREAALRAFPRA